MKEKNIHYANDINKNTEWTKNSWRKFNISQQPMYNDLDLLNNITDKISKFPPLVHHEDICDLKYVLKKCHTNEKFIIQIGDCAERFIDCEEDIIKKKLEFYFLIGKILEFHLKKEVVVIGRIAGQYAKPRSSPYEFVNNVKVESYRGDIIHSFELTDRLPDPNRLTEAYYKSSSTLNYIQNFNLHDIKKINESSFNNLFNAELSDEIKQKLNFFAENFPKNEINYDLKGKIFTSHEGLLLNYEECFLRKIEKDFYNLSSHFLWIGERTNNIKEAHLEFFRGIENPIGIKISSRIKNEDIIDIIKILNPKNLIGKIFLITRYGLENVNEGLDILCKKLNENNLNINFICDPNHGNTKVDPQTKKKVRYFDDLKNEIIFTNKILLENGYFLSGIHLESSFSSITECFGGFSNQINNIEIDKYTTYCDPRLNLQQTIELVDSVGKVISEN